MEICQICNMENTENIYEVFYGKKKDNKKYVLKSKPFKAYICNNCIQIEKKNSIKGMIFFLILLILSPVIISLLLLKGNLTITQIITFVIYSILNLFVVILILFGISKMKNDLMGYSLSKRLIKKELGIKPNDLFPKYHFMSKKKVDRMTKLNLISFDE